jgi:hypothetical protein
VAKAIKVLAEPRVKVERLARVVEQVVRVVVAAFAMLGRRNLVIAVQREPMALVNAKGEHLHVSMGNGIRPVSARFFRAARRMFATAKMKIAMGKSTMASGRFLVGLAFVKSR